MGLRDRAGTFPNGLPASGEYRFRPRLARRRAPVDAPTACQPSRCRTDPPLEPRFSTDRTAPPCTPLQVPESAPLQRSWPVPCWPLAAPARTRPRPPRLPAARARLGDRARPTGTPLGAAAELPALPVSVVVRLGGRPELGPVDRQPPRRPSRRSGRSRVRARSPRPWAAAAAARSYAGTIALRPRSRACGDRARVYAAPDQNTIVRTLQEVDLPGQLRSALVDVLLPHRRTPRLPLSPSRSARSVSRPGSGTCPTCAICVVATARKHAS